MKVAGAASIVTGGASGLGAATARSLAAQGARITLFDLNDETGAELADELGCRFAKVDVTDEDNVTAALDAAAEANGIARVLVNCAGIAPAKKAVGKEYVPHDMATFRKAIEINLVGTFLTASRFAARLQQAEPIGEERGIIINTASVAAFEGQIGQPAYGASKAGVVGLGLPPRTRVRA